MSYTKQNLHTNDVITEEYLNNIENALEEASNKTIDEILEEVAVIRNLYDKTKATPGVLPNGTSFDGVYTTAPITVAQGDILKFYCQKQGIHVIHPSWEGELNVDIGPGAPYTFTCNESGTITFALYTEEYDTVRITKNEDGSVSETITQLKSDVKIDYSNLNDSTANKIVKSRLAGKTWLSIGDSITWGFKIPDRNQAYNNIIANRNNMSLMEDAIVGSPITGSSNESENMVVRLNNHINDNVDYVTIFGGTNDFGVHSTNLGSLGDTDSSTFYGALDVICKTLLDKFAGKKVAMFTPLHRRGTTEDIIGEDDTNSVGNNLSVYVKAIKEVTAKYGIPCLDLNSMCPINPNFSGNMKALFDNGDGGDGLHPNDAGHHLLADVVEEFLQTL